jgi:hypothetical protein
MQVPTRISLGHAAKGVEQVQWPIWHKFSQYLCGAAFINAAFGNLSAAPSRRVLGKTVQDVLGMKWDERSGIISAKPFTPF